MNKIFIVQATVMYFLVTKVDVVLLRVGLGGKYDRTSYGKFLQLVELFPFFIPLRIIPQSNLFTFTLDIEFISANICYVCTMNN